MEFDKKWIILQLILWGRFQWRAEWQLYTVHYLFYVQYMVSPATTLSVPLCWLIQPLDVVFALVINLFF